MAQVHSIYHYFNICSDIDCMMYAAAFNLFEEVMSKFKVNTLNR